MWISSKGGVKSEELPCHPTESCPIHPNAWHSVQRVQIHIDYQLCASRVEWMWSQT